MEVLALADPLGRQSRLLAGLRSAFAVRDLALRQASHDELALEASVQQAGGTTRVDPDRPLLWLAPGLTSSGQTQEDRFVAFENYSAARAVALLTTAPVLNRPTVVGPCGTMPANRALAARQVVHALGVTDWPERFTSRPAQGPPLQEVLDYGTGRTAWNYPEGAEGPFRTRRAVNTSRTALVHVIGSMTVSPWPVPSIVAELSVRAAEFFALDLASVWWTGSTNEPYLSRIECWHWNAGLGPSLLPLAEAVADWMSKRLAAAPESVA